MGAIVPDAVERYLASLNRQKDALLDELAAEGRAEKLPLIDAEVGVLLNVLTRASGARRILEIGTAIGYSGIWLARALPEEGTLVTIDADADRARRARENFARAGLSARVNVVVGDAADIVPSLDGPFDVIYQDGPKDLYLPLLDRLIELLRPGGLLVTDNVLWDGEVVPGFVATPRRDSASTRTIAAYNDQLAARSHLVTSVVPLRDGVAVSVKRGGRVD
jgi:caffeoyl-CoA O-methyltransferase